MEKHALHIRPAHSGEGPALVALWARSVDATHDFLTPADRAAIGAEVAAFLPEAPLIVAADASDRPLGFMLLDGGRMEALFLDPDQRGQGVGRALVEHALGLHPRLETEVNAQNQQALGFYLHLGFVETGRSALDGQGRAYPLIHLRHDA
ncbi:acetyltransferase [Paracoccus aminophilus]|uniref:Acetyltransferase n=1 Tax=Paracoccus aminophilus JCM 7686 TaxID=1367847 RepID=S5XLL9_PARAH|nr:acetyltransferase [Paracoccus aminophilus]AGT08099.1 acetyltransferase [Paracoccus aminophilus JCM 7686]